MTNNTIDLKDAIRAYKDRPSMERELAELRQLVREYDQRYAAMAGTIERLKMEDIQRQAECKLMCRKAIEAIKLETDAIARAALELKTERGEE